MLVGLIITSGCEKENCVDDTFCIECYESIDVISFDGDVSSHPHDTTFHCGIRDNQISLFEFEYFLYHIIDEGDAYHISKCKKIE